MRTDCARQQVARRTHIESLEDRLVMSANALGDLLAGQVQYHLLANESLASSSVPPLSLHQSIDPHPTSENQQLQHHLERDADFWITPGSEIGLEQSLQDIELTLASAHNQTGLTQVQTEYGFRGQNQTVAIIDSGIAYSHYALGGGLGNGYRVVGGFDFTEGDSDPYDDGPEGGHGTHVAGIVGGDAGSNSGVAPDVDLVGLRVFNDSGNGFFSWVEQALDWVHTNRNSYDNPITAVNLSLGTYYNSESIPQWAMLEDEFAQLKADGIFISVSAGNSFASFNTPGLSYPAASPHVVPVMSTDSSGQLSSFSQRHQSAIGAPGRWITSTVPDYAASDADSIDDDFATWSGTSMAAPYIAGASVIVREAMEFSGYSNITQDTIYNHMVATADSFFDTATSQYYNRLNLESAIDALMPTDDFGNSSADACNLGAITSENTTEVSGVIGTLDDSDYFGFTADATGTVTFTATTSHELTSDWYVLGGVGSVSGTQGEAYIIDVVGGQSYYVGISSADGVGYYDLEIEAESSFTFEDWGQVDSDHYQDITSAGESWYRLVASQAGYLTSEATFSSATGNIDLALYDSNLNVLVSSSEVGDVERVDWLASAAEEFYLRVIGTNSEIDFQLTNLVAVTGEVVDVTGTAGDDTFAFAAGADHQVSVNGVIYDFAAGSIDTVNFDGSAGSDTITMTGTSADEIATVRVNDVTFAGAGFTVSAVQIENVSIDGGGGFDVADMFDDAGDDTFVAHPTWAQLSGAGYSHLMSGFGEVNAYGSGGNDEAFFYDSTGDDTYVGGPTYGRLHGSGYDNWAEDFDTYQAYASTGDDRAVFYDSAGDETYVATPEYARFDGSSFCHQADGFNRTDAYATEGGNDWAYFYDSAGDDSFKACPTWARLAGSDYYNYADSFDRVYAYATAGGSDRAYLYDSAGNDTFRAYPTWARLAGSDYYNYAGSFDRVYAYATAGGSDLAYLYDSAGNDFHKAYPTWGRLAGSGYYNYAGSFDRVFAYATAGGYDIAILCDSAGNDSYKASPTWARLAGSGYYNYADSFDRVHAYATAGGYDQAYLYDSSGNDVFHSYANSEVLLGDGFYNYTQGFDQTSAYASEGQDQAIVDTVLQGESLYGVANLARISRFTSTQRICEFDHILADVEDLTSIDLDTTAVDYLFELDGEAT
jgi:subtilisin family serine protease